MVVWKLYIDSHQKRALDLCGGSLTEGCGEGAGLHGNALLAADDYGYGYGEGDGNGFGWYGFGDGDGRSASEW